MSKRTVALIVLSIFVLTLGLAGCGKKAEPTQAKVLKVGTEATFAPFEFQKENSKEYTGFDMDLIRAVGKQMGYEVQIQNMGFDGLIPALESGQIDVIAAAMTITDERAKKVAFTEPYYQSGLTIVVNKNNTAIKSFKELEGKNIAVQIGTTGANEAHKVPGATVREYNSATEAYMELKTGATDAVLNDRPVNGYYLAQGGSKDAKELPEVLQAENYGLAVNKKNTALLEQMNKALAELKKNGEYQKIYEKWFSKQQ